MNRSEPPVSSLSTSLVSPELPILLFFVMFGIMATYLLRESMAEHAIDRTVSTAKVGATPMVQAALDQVRACEKQARPTYNGDRAWTSARLVVWNPCVQQGDVALQAQHAEASVDDFHRRLVPMERLVQARFSTSS